MRQTEVVTTEDLAYLRQASLRTVLFCMLAVLYAWCLISFQPVNQVGATAWGPVLLGGGLLIAFLVHAMSSLSLVPVFVIFIAFQRYLVQGISTTGLKG